MAALSAKFSKAPPAYPMPGIFIVCALLLVVALSALFHKAPAIEADITERVTTAVAKVAGDRPVQVEVDGRHVALRGFVTDESEREAVVRAVKNTWGAIGPADYLRLRAAQSPYRLKAARSAAGIVGITGLAQDELTREAITQAATKAFGKDVASVDINYALGAPAESWVVGAAAAFDALAGLESGVAVMDGDVITIDGVAHGEASLTAMQSARQRAEAADFGWVENIETRFRFRAEKSADAVWTVRADADDEEMIATIEAEMREVAGEEAVFEWTKRRTSAPEMWREHVFEAIDALSVAESGWVTLTGEQAEIDAVAAGREAFEELATLTDGAATGRTWRRKIALSEVSEPQAVGETSVRSEPVAVEAAALRISIDARSDGQAAPVTMAGVLPKGMSLDEAHRLLGFSAVSDDIAGVVRTGGRGDLQVWRDSLAALGEYLPEFERMDAVIRADGGRVEGVLTPASDDEQVTAALAQRLGAELELRPSAESIAEGAKRVNPLTGVEETFRNGYWLPAVEIGSMADCPRRADLVLVNGRIRFLTNSADLDVRARRLLNEIAAIAAACFDSTALTIEIGGHTDNTGDTGYNRSLSERRAEAVVAALTARGVTAERMSARGYGDSTPIADNNTAEGRAANRRISFRWRAP
ncbi:MAG: OmpA family protein [Rhodobacteraceae bacterium]|nr:OmpA family protein [Paracoccaceae bacterium]